MVVDRDKPRRVCIHALWVEWVEFLQNGQNLKSRRYFRLGGILAVSVCCQMIIIGRCSLFVDILTAHTYRLGCKISDLLFGTFGKEIRRGDNEINRREKKSESPRRCH